MKCCLSSSSTFPLMMSVTSITAKTNQGHWVNWKMGEEGTPWGTEATVTQKRGGIISCGNFRAVYRVTWWKPALAPRPTQTLEGTGYSNQADEIWNNPLVYKCLPPRQQFHHSISTEELNRRWRDPPQGYLPPRRVCAAPMSTSSCCCPAAPSCPHARSDTQNWSSLSSGPCCPGPTSSSNIRLLSNSWISSSISAGRGFAAQNLPLLCKPLTKSALRGDFVTIFKHLPGVLCQLIP